jgi:hypothetical protein
LTPSLHQLIQRWEGQVVQILFTYLLPHMLNRIDFGTLGWLKDQANVFWKVELFCSMPAGPIGLHDDKIFCKDFCDMRQKDIHLGIRCTLTH